MSIFFAEKWTFLPAQKKNVHFFFRKVDIFFWQVKKCPLSESGNKKCPHSESGHLFFQKSFFVTVTSYGVTCYPLTRPSLTPASRFWIPWRVTGDRWQATGDGLTGDSLTGDRWRVTAWRVTGERWRAAAAGMVFFIRGWGSFQNVISPPYRYRGKTRVLLYTWFPLIKFSQNLWNHGTTYCIVPWYLYWCRVRSMVLGGSRYQCGYHGAR